MADDGHDAGVVFDPVKLEAAAARFRHLVAVNSPGRAPFRSFRAGVIDAEEGYKLRLRKAAWEELAGEHWRPQNIGRGWILERVISAIDQEGNNLLQRDERNGPKSRDDIRLLEARDDPALRREAERLLFRLYAEAGEEPGPLFGDFVKLFGRNFPLLGYLFFLKDPNIFTPVRPQGLEKGLRELGIDLKLQGQASWETYSDFLGVLQALRPALRDVLDLEDVRLIDAHSFVWVIGDWTEPRPGQSSKASSLGEMEVAGYCLAQRILNTVGRANGQVEERRVKDKATDMNREELVEHMRELMRQSGGRCAITGLPLQMPQNFTDPDMQASPDRINSDLGYVRGNIQVVCWFINRWKADDRPGNFARLIELVRSSGPAEPSPGGEFS